MSKKGEKGIQTLDSSLFRTIPVFKTGAINHSKPKEDVLKCLQVAPKENALRATNKKSAQI